MSSKNSKQKVRKNNFAIKVGFADITVKHTKMKDFGEFDSSELAIRINDTLDSWMYMQTLRHEILHAGAFVFGMSDMDLKEERWVDFSSAIFTMVERDNLGIFGGFGRSASLLSQEVENTAG
jgi:hypothetical protein